MGHGIAQAMATAGWPTYITDSRPESLPSALAAIERNLEGAVSRGKLSPDSRDAALANLHIDRSFLSACRDANLVVEAVFEDLATKRAVLLQAAEVASPGALLATNTSSLSVAAIAEGSPYPDRVIGLHFFNPVHLMKLVEIVTHDGTNEAARADALAVVEALGKEPIVVKDSPGFASSRLGLVLGLEAIRMLEQGVASATDIDRAMELGYNHPMGPLRLTDLVGLDVRLRIAEYLHQSLGGAQYEAPALLRSKVAEGKLGRKTGLGFYEWEKK
ncbi:MAG: 3-hydroxyacyl-CoA dehydrogenase family protein [Gemmatimonadota bacterium]